MSSLAIFRVKSVRVVSHSYFANNPFIVRRPLSSMAKLNVNIPDLTLPDGNKIPMVRRALNLPRVMF